MEHVIPINSPPALLISFYSGYEGADKAISFHEQVLAILYRLPVTSETQVLYRRHCSGTLQRCPRIVTTLT